jgi:hypothetical protein
MRAAKMGKRGRKKTNNNKPNLIETLLACLPFNRVRAKSRLQHSCQSSQIHDGRSPLFLLPPSLKEDNATASSAAGGSKLSKDSLSLVEARHMSKNTRRKGGIAAEEEKKRRCSKKPRKKALQKRNTPKQAPYENMTPRRAASRF